MGLTGSKLEKALASHVPDHERYFGLENFGNTCYCNSVLQALYFCIPFRESLLEYYTNAPKLSSSSSSFSSSSSSSLGGSSSSDVNEDNLLMCLGELFNSISTQKKKSGVIAPRKFVQRLRKENELFRGYMHQDAHEFLNYLLNNVAEILQKEQKEQKKLKEQKEAEEHHTGDSSEDRSQDGDMATDYSMNNNNGVNYNNNNNTNSNHVNGIKLKKKKKHKTTDPAVVQVKSYPNTEGGTFVHDIFEGTLTNETKCLSCESITSKDESFLDLSIDIEQHSSLTNCLAHFSSIEMLSRGDKFYCDKCCSLQEAQKRMKIKKLPKILVIHLKRFKFIEQIQQYKKLNHRVVFPLELILQNTSHDAEDPDRRYDLFAVVIHVGSGPNHGHYVSMVKSHNTWLIFDDDNIDVIQEGDIGTCFGAASEMLTQTDCGYLLFYQCVQEAFSRPFTVSS